MNQWIERMHSEIEIHKIISPGIFLTLGNIINVTIIDIEQIIPIGAFKINFRLTFY